MNQRKKQSAEILAILKEKIPEPRSELHYQNPWQLLVAAVLSAQTTDKQVNKVTAVLFKKYPGPKEMAALTPDELAEEIHNVGLYRNKSKHLVAAARMVIERYGGKVPQSFTELRSLPGVGRKTANVVLSNAFSIPALAVDTHIFRVARRLGLARGKTPEKVELELTRLIHESLWSDAHHWLILHGRYTCKARKPDCPLCDISAYCRHYQKTNLSTGGD
jgi:endonuclease-3